jgi:hypothetical protein
VPGQNPRAGQRQCRVQPGADDKITGGDAVPAAAEFELHPSVTFWGESSEQT